jgi:hypothetical protein
MAAIRNKLGQGLLLAGIAFALARIVATRPKLPEERLPPAQAPEIPGSPIGRNEAVESPLEI